MEEIYLDNSATTPTDPEAARLAVDMMCQNYGNPSSLHRKGFEAQLAVDRAREQATPYLKALSWLWGIGPLEVVAAQNMDYVSAEAVEEKVQAAIEEGLRLAEQF